MNSLVHATKPEAAVDILVNGFKPNEKNLGPHFPEDTNNFIWWGISPDRKDIEKYSERCERFTKKYMKKEHNIDVEHEEDTEEDEEGSIAESLSALSIQDRSKREDSLRLGRQEWKEQLDENFCSSPPFCVTSRYGNVIFEYNIDQLMKAYSSQYCDNKKPEFLVLGTFAYTQEVMHAVLVCPPKVIKRSEDLPLIDENNSVIYKSGHNWVWTPETTGSRANYFHTNSKNIKFNKYRKWEHATFAFFVPDNQSLKLDNLDMQMTYCPPSVLFRLHTTEDDKGKWTLNGTLQFFHDTHIMNNIFFLNFIHRCLVNVWKKDVKQTEGVRLSHYMKLKTSYIENLLGTFAVTEHDGHAIEYDPDELLESVSDPAKCTERWQLWIRQIAHYLLDN